MKTRYCSMAAVLLLLPHVATGQRDPLPSWNDGSAKQAVLDFVAGVTREGDGFVPPSQRIAVFDDNGTLWAEQPVPVQLAFATDRIRSVAAQHPDWKEKEPFRSLLAGKTDALLAGGEAAVREIIASTHAGITPEQFSKIVFDWMTEARHPRFKVGYFEMIYRPMVELLVHLRANGFKVFIVSSGSVELMRVWSEEVYRVPAEQVIGSTVATRLEERDGVPVLIRQPKIDSLGGSEGKPIAIDKFTGRRPILAFGNSDDDLPMLRWTAAGEGRRLVAVVRHTDGEREWAYDRNSPVGRLDKALDEAKEKGWVVIDMKRDWKRVFPFLQ